MTKKKKSIFHVLEILRPYQWSKNFLVFLPIILAQDFDYQNFKEGLNCFIVFSLTASAVYILNDIIDLKHDKKHKYKKFRPLASGLINLKQCWFLIFFLLVPIIVFIKVLNLNFYILIFTYFVISNLYTFFLKKLIIIDILTLGILYTFRIIGGGLALDITLSVWLISFSFFFFLSLASLKRLIEIIDGPKNLNFQIPGRAYMKQDQILITILSLSAGMLSVLIFILYLNSNQFENYYNNSKVLWGVCIVLSYWILRINILTTRNKIKIDPIIFALKDKASYWCLLVIITLMIISKFI
jgi:4-hydroxybenzoate polyprenyltransferase